MAEIVFPDSPSSNQIVYLAGVYWQWNGSSWEPMNPAAGIAEITNGSLSGGSASAGSDLFIINEIQPKEVVTQEVFDLRAIIRTSANASAVIPQGTTAQRDSSPSPGLIRYNTTLNNYESYSDSGWRGFIPTFDYEERTSNTMLDVNDRGKYINVTTAGFTQTFDNPSNLGAGWYCYLKNSSTQDIEMPESLGPELLLNGTIDQAGSNVIVNGTFDADSDWTKGTGWTISGGTAVGTATTGNLTAAVAPLANGTFYRVTYDTTVTSGSVRVVVGGVNGTTRSASGTYTEYFNPTTTAFLVDGVTSYTGTVDNIVVEPLAYWNNDVTGSAWNGTQLTFTTYTQNTSAAVNTTGFTLTSGKLYEITYTITRSAGSMYFNFDTTYNLTSRSSSGTYTERFIAEGSYTTLYVYGSTFSGSLTEVSLKEVSSWEYDGDSTSKWVIYPKEARLFFSTGSTIKSLVVNSFVKEYSSSDIWYKPPGYTSFTVQLWGGGGGGSGAGAGTNNSAGGGGGAYNSYNFIVSQTNTLNLTIGAGGSGGGATTDGSSGGDTSFGNLLTAYGGGGGDYNTNGGGGGGQLSSGNLTAGGAPWPGGTLAADGISSSLFGGASAAQWSVWGGASGALQPLSGGSSFYGGPGGGAGGDTGGGSEAGTAGGSPRTITAGGGGAGGIYNTFPTSAREGQAGSSPYLGWPVGTGGGGGAYNSSGTGYAGGAGGIAAGGGGGGSGSTNGGIGGTGGGGYAIITGIL